MPTGPTPEFIRLVSDQWALRGDVNFLRLVENYVYDADDSDAIVRLTAPTRKGSEQIEAELAWIDFLAAEGIRVARPRRSVTGRFVESLSIGEQSYHAVVFEKVRGKQVETYSDELFETWGAYLARLHDVTQTYVPGRARRPEWNEEPGFREAVSAMAFPDADQQLKREFEGLIRWMRQLTKRRENYGLVHADLHPGNFFLSEAGEITAFDFDDSHYTFFAYDLAVPLFLVLMKHRNESSSEAWNRAWTPLAAGYNRTRENGQANEEEVRRFLRLRVTIMAHWCTSRIRANALDAPKIAWAKDCIAFCRDYLGSEPGF